jgi:hypothetical protein
LNYQAAAAQTMRPTQRSAFSAISKQFIGSAARAWLKLLLELGRRHDLKREIAATVEKYAGLIPELLRVTGGDQMVRSRELADRWSAAVVALVRQAHPDALQN